MGQDPKQKQTSRLSQLRKYIPTAQDAEIVKEMIADGLSDEDILHALGYVSGNPSRNVLPNGHEHSNQMTTEQQEKEERAAGLGQPGEVEGGDEDGDGAGGEDDILTHVAGLLTHASKRKAKNGVKGGPAGANRG